MDYASSGLRVGLEIHQQLASGHKLFCHCPIELKHGLTEKDFPINIKRKLRPVAGELGEIDPAALYEFYRSRTFTYSMNSGTSCLVETDEEPPHAMNFAALVTVLQACKLLQCSIVDEIHVMRKTVIDGSAVSGFQRTALIGTDGTLKLSTGAVKITTVCVEEDAATILEKKGSTVNYRLDRLGIPLIEIATDSTISSPEQAREVAEKIGSLLRSTDVVRGIGSIRQDVNVSIRDGARVEIKGFQELEKMEKLIENEAERQRSLIEIKKELEKRGFKSPGAIKDATKIFKDTECNFIKKSVDEGNSVHALLLQKFAHLLKKQCGSRTFGKELNDYAQAHGYGIIHSDEDLSKYKLVYEFEELRKMLGAEEEDLVVITAGKEPQKALAAIAERASQCLTGVPEETRVADDTGSKYTRPLPGGERMYPESDIPTEILDEELTDSIEIPKTLEERGKELEKILPKEIVSQLTDSRLLNVFERLYEHHPSSPVLIANTLLSTIKDMKRKSFEISKISEEDLDTIFAAVDSGKIPKKSIRPVLEKICEGVSVKEAVESLTLIDDKELEKLVEQIISKNPGAGEHALMGIIMESIHGRADGEAVLQLIRKLQRRR